MNWYVISKKPMRCFRARATTKVVRQTVWTRLMRLKVVRKAEVPWIFYLVDVVSPLLL